MAKKKRSLISIIIPLGLAMAILSLVVTILLIITNPSQLPVNNDTLQPTMTPESSADVLIAKAKENLIREIATGITVAEIEVVKVERRNWSDTSLGCPQPGMVYAQVITPGYQIILQANGELYDYRTDLKGNVKLCPQKLSPPAGRGSEIQ